MAYDQSYFREIEEQQALFDEECRTFRFTYKSLDFPTKAAKRLKKFFETYEGLPEITIGRARAIVSQLAGYGSWEQMKSALDPASPDRADHDLPSDKLGRRRGIQQKRLAHLSGMRDDLSSLVIATVEPTGSATGLLRWDEDPYFELERLPVGKNGRDALSAIGAHSTKNTIIECLEPDGEEFGFYFSRCDIFVAKAERFHDTALTVFIDGIHRLDVEYERSVGLDLGLEFWEEADDYRPHPRPLRPVRAKQMEVEYLLKNVTVIDPVSQDAALEHAAAFILLDILRTTCLCARSVETKIEAVELSIDTNFDDPSWWSLSTIIEGMYRELLIDDEAHDLGLRKVAPFPERLVLEDN
jgi:hypothetical protein